MRKVMGLTSQAKGYVEWNLERLASIQISHGYSTQQVNVFPPAAAALPPPPTVGFCLAGCRSLLFWLSSSPACPWLFGGLRGRRDRDAKRQSKQAQNISWTDAPQHRVRFELRKYNVSLNCTDYCPSKSMPCDCSITHWI